MATRTRIIAVTVLRAALLFAIWLAIDDNVSQPELFTGIGVALLALGLASIVTRAGTVSVGVRPAMLRRLYRAPMLLVGDSFRVCWAVIETLVLRRRVEGRFRAVRYRAGGENQTDAARRVLTEWSASIAPNRYVIGIDPETNSLLVHELVGTRGPVDPLELG